MFVLLDSGAYTAWTSGKAIALEDYIAYVQANKDYLDLVASLDALPGSPKRGGSQAEIAESSRQSYNNHQRMKEAGAVSFPTFHLGEAFSVLQRYLDDGDQYIGISPLATASNAAAEEWLDEVFTILTDDLGRPVVKTHGFAMTRTNLVLRYPWTTVDSTSWRMQGSMGFIIVPSHFEGTPVYTQNPIQISVSGVSTARPKASTNTLSPLQLERIDAYLQSTIGHTLAEARESKVVRMMACLHCYQQYEAACADKVRFRHRIRSLWGPKQAPKRPAIRQPALRILAAVGVSNSELGWLKQGKQTSALVSYAYLRQAPVNSIAHLHQHGTFAKRTKQ